MNKYKKILEKVMDLIHLSDRDEMLYGNSYIEFGERSIKVLDPTKVNLTKFKGIHTKK